MIKELAKEGFLRLIIYKNEELYILSTACRVIIAKEIIEVLKSKYLAEEEIGGILLGQARKINNEHVWWVDEIRFLRNTIEDKPLFNKDGVQYKKSFSYLMATDDYKKASRDAFDSGRIPIKFHTHPTKGHSIVEESIQQNLQMATSDDDLLESKRPDDCDGIKLLLPRTLIVGNRGFGEELFIGVYDGFIAPPSFEQSIKHVRSQHINKIAKSLSQKIESLHLTDTEKLLYGIAAVFVTGLFLYHARKVALPALGGLAIIVPLTLTNTASIENPPYYNRLVSGDANIYIPEDNEEFIPQT